MTTPRNKTEDHNGQLLHVELDKLHPDPDQPRKHFDKQGLKDLAADIEQRGILQPLLIRDYITEDETKPGHFIIVTGERRYRAAKLAKLKTVPGVVDNSANDAPLDRLLAQVSENCSREDLNPIELARFFARLVEDFGYTANTIPKLLEASGLKAMSRSYVSNTMRLVKLPDWAQQYIIDGKITQRHGLALLPALHSEKVLKDLKPQVDDALDSAEKWSDEPFTVDLAEDIVERLFMDNHALLDRKWGEQATLYQWDAKQDGEALGIVKIGSYHFALNQEEHERRQQEAKAELEKKEEQRQQRAKKKASKKTGNNKNDDSEPEKEIRRPPDHKISTYLFGVEGSESTPQGGWLRRHILDIIGTLDPDTLYHFDDIRYRLFVWCALQCPEVGGGSFFSDDVAITADSAVTGETYAARKCGYGSLLPLISLKLPLAELIEEQARFAISRMHVNNLALLALHLEVNLDAAWRVDEDYLALYTGPALEEMARDSLADHKGQADYICGLPKVADKRIHMLSIKEEIGVTDDIRRIWEETLDAAQREVAEQREAIEKADAETTEAAE